MFVNCRNILFLISVFLLPLPSFANDITHEIGVLDSSYRYREADLKTYDGKDEDISIEGFNFGLSYTGIFKLDSNWFAELDIITMFGQLDYKSKTCGTKDNEFNWYLDLRGLWGKNIYFDSATFSPYLGIGSRYLYNDFRGKTSNGKIGYRRESNYLYFPLGFFQELQLTYNSGLVFNMEVDFLALGMQKSYLSDVNSYNSDFVNWQHLGFGARCSLMYRVYGFAIGPYLSYWQIEDSESVYALDPKGDIWRFVEPKNYTIEAGLKISYRF